jgi:hypothetical protein
MSSRALDPEALRATCREEREDGPQLPEVRQPEPLADVTARSLVAGRGANARA